MTDCTPAGLRGGQKGATLCASCLAVLHPVWPMLLGMAFFCAITRIHWSPCVLAVACALSLGNQIRMVQA